MRSLGWPLHTVMGNFEGLWCQEVVTANEFMEVNCRKQAVALVWHAKDRRAYLMCFGCANHNIENRGGRLVVDNTKGAVLLREIARTNDPKWET